MSALLDTSLQLQAKHFTELSEVENIIGRKKPTIKSTGHNTKVGIIEGYFDPRSDTKNSLSKSTKSTFVGQNSQLVAFQAHAEDLGGNHANHVSSIIHQLAPEAQLRVIDMYHEASVRCFSSHDARLISAIDAAIASKVNFINISQRISPDTDQNGEISKEVKKALYRARDAGIGIIKSAGNDNEFIGSTPYTKSLAKLLYKMQGSMVLATATAYEDTQQENLAPFSNKAGIAHKYTVSVPGTKILAYGASHQLVKMSGTSMAAPVLTAAASLLKESYPELSTKDILRSIRYSARKINLNQTSYLSAGKYGCGVMNFHAAHRKAKKINKLRLGSSGNIMKK